MQEIPFELPGFIISQVRFDESRFIITAQARGPTSPCPACHQPSKSVHSYYQRVPGDLPVCGKQVRLVLTVRRFRCTFSACSKKVFAERLPQLLLPHAQRTKRLSDALQVFADNFSAKLAARVFSKLKMPVSPATLLRLVKNPLNSLTQDEIEALKVISLDDFAFKRGRTYGTLILDLLNHRPVDLLADRKAETVAEWLKSHPTIEIVSRDRSPEYARGITLGAPQALQVADRWHIFKNWRDVLERILTGQQARLKEKLAQAGLSVKTTRKSRQKTSVTQRVASAAARQRRVERYDQVKVREGQGQSILQISEELQMSRMTVRKYLSLENPPAPIERRRVRYIGEPYLTHLEKRWQERCHNAKQLWRELKEQGFKGTYKPVQRWASLHRDKPGRLLSEREKARLIVSGRAEEPILPPLPLALEKQVGPGFEPLPLPRQLVWLFLKEEKELKLNEQKWLEFIAQDSILGGLRQTSQKFISMIKEHRAAGLDEWLEESSQNPLLDVQTFAEGIRREYEAIKAGLTLPWSQGPIEGHINKLKLIKRTSYGRGSLELLRQRVLRAA